MKKYTNEQVREWIWRRYPGYRIATLEYDDISLMWIAVIFANPTCIDRIRIDIDEDGDLSLWNHEVCRWELLYRGGEE